MWGEGFSYPLYGVHALRSGSVPYAALFGAGKRAGLTNATAVRGHRVDTNKRPTTEKEIARTSSGKRAASALNNASIPPMGPRNTGSFISTSRASAAASKYSGDPPNSLPLAMGTSWPGMPAYVVSRDRSKPAGALCRWSVVTTMKRSRRVRKVSMRPPRNLAGSAQPLDTSTYRKAPVSKGLTLLASRSQRTCCAASGVWDAS